MLVRSYHKTYGLNTIITSCSNNFGPYQHSEKLIPTVIKSALKHQPIPIYGSGLNVRDWLFVEDHCRALQVIFDKAEPGSRYNIGGNNESVVPHVNGFLVRPKDPGELSKAIMNILGDEKLRLGFQKESIRLYNHNFGENIQLKNYFLLYEELLAAHRKQTPNCHNIRNDFQERALLQIISRELL